MVHSAFVNAIIFQPSFDTARAYMQQLDHPLIGARIQLIYTEDPYTLLCPGEAGYVIDVDDTGIIHVEWDNGSNLGRSSRG